MVKTNREHSAGQSNPNPELQCIFNYYFISYLLFFFSHILFFHTYFFWSQCYILILRFCSIFFLFSFLHSLTSIMVRLKRPISRARSAYYLPHSWLLQTFCSGSCLLAHTDTILLLFFFFVELYVLISCSEKQKKFEM